MSERGQQLYDALKKLNTPQASVHPGIVRKVNVNTADVEIDGLLYEGVQLQASIADDVQGILITPRVDSVVLVQRILSSNEFSIILFSQVDEVVQETGNAKIIINNDGIGMNAGGEDLLTVFIDFVEACISERHLTKSGPTINLSAESRQRFENIKTRLKKLLQNA